MGKAPRYSEVLQKVNGDNGCGRPEQIQVIHNMTLETIFDGYLKYYGMESGYNFQTTYQGSLAVAIQECKNDTTIVLLNLSEIDPELYANYFCMKQDEVSRHIKWIQDAISPLLDKLKELCAPVLFFSFEMDFWEERSSQRNGICEIADEMNRFLRQYVVKSPNIHVVDVNQIIARVGACQFYDPRGYYLNLSLYTKSACNALADQCVKLLNRINGEVKKCLILDCDNVLWGGSVADDGFDHIKMGQGYPGKAFQDFQREILKLYYRGVLVCLCSKNNEADVMSVLRTHPDCLLKPEHIVSYRINWVDKATNILEIADELNLSLDSFVFVDDNGYEVGLIHEKLPQIKTICLDASKPYKYACILRECGLFVPSKITEEDCNRTSLYKNERRREKEKEYYIDVEAYQKSLQTVLTIRFATDFHVPRLAQLSQRTNQFNLTARKYTDQEMELLIHSSNKSVILMEASDKFGGMGIVGNAVLDYTDDAAYIRAFMLSCRIFGRHFEDVLLAQIEKLAISKGCSRLIGEYVPTEKNQRFSDFYLKHGFHPYDERFILDTTIPIQYPDYFYQIKGL